MPRIALRPLVLLLTALLLPAAAAAQSPAPATPRSPQPFIAPL